MKCQNDDAIHGFGLWVHISKLYPELVGKRFLSNEVRLHSGGVLLDLRHIQRVPARRRSTSEPKAVGSSPTGCICFPPSKTNSKAIKNNDLEQIASNRFFLRQSEKGANPGQCWGYVGVVSLVSQQVESIIQIHQMRGLGNGMA